MNNKKTTIATLNGLIEICRDGEEGFRLAAEGVEDSELRALFLEFSALRSEFVEELQAEVNRLGGAPQASGTASGAAHRGWMRIREAVSANDDAAIVAECERGEDAAKAAYEKAIESDIDQESREIIERQYAEVREAHDRVRALETAQRPS